MAEGKEPVRLFRLESENITAEVLDIGALIHSIKVADRNGKIRDVVLGLDNIEDYHKPHPNLGLTIGRVANRIRNGKFTLDGKTYTLNANSNGHHLHGGPNGFGRRVWTPECADNQSVTFRIFSPDGEENYPGDLTATLTYTVADNALILDYAAAASKPTPVNLTNHVFFNLSGGERDITDHVVRIDASRYVETDDALIPTGRLGDVAGTGYDFRQPKTIRQGFSELGNGKGFDVCYAFDNDGSALAPIAEVFDPDSGIVMHTCTCEPGVQFYTANFFNGDVKGKKSTPYTKHFGLCLETQRFPDAPNHPNFPDITLRPGELYRSRTVYAFSTRD